MTGVISINLVNSIESVSVLDNCPESVKADTKYDRHGNEFTGHNSEKELNSACKALNAAAAKIQNLYEDTITQRKDEIVKLSLEIARKILMYKIETKDYEIESIIKEALNNCPSSQDLIIHLNPEDFEQCRKIQEKETNGILSAVKLIADPNVKPAEFILKSPKGTIFSQINDQLEQIGKALGKVK